MSVRQAVAVNSAILLAGMITTGCSAPIESQAAASRVRTYYVAAD